jgi:glutamate dehydrogenase (NAD(P)+)
MYMGEREMAWFAEANGDRRACTGKPESIGGLPHEQGGTGFGIYHAARVATEMLDIDLKKATFAVEGFGTVGKPTAKYLSEAGARFIAVSDSQGTISDPDGLSYQRLEAIKQQGLSVTEYTQDKGRQICSRDSCSHILDVKADILITAAKADVIKSGDVDRLNFKLIVEGSNIPMSFWVENLCHKKGITVVPDLIANAGGVITSYIEYSGNGHHNLFDLIQEKVSNNTRKIIEESQRTNRMPRKCALNLAKNRVASQPTLPQGEGFGRELHTARAHGRGQPNG